ncbi:Membrane-bound lysozyme-inhibitor of c-type lysozyme [[Pasteurella] aerogenes]|nr:Membrane-bound lysozyme-inhibitor of c-type lysozyme [[Pasteurella] aerogenes]
MFRLGFLLLTALVLNACRVQIEPLEINQPPVVKPKSIDKSVQTGKADLYLCKDQKEVRVVRSLVSNKKNNLKSISLTFENATHKLMQTISESGMRYTDIHWQWQERLEYSTLSNARGEVLAEQCMLQN